MKQAPLKLIKHITDIFKFEGLDKLKSEPCIFKTNYNNLFFEKKYQGERRYSQIMEL